MELKANETMQIETKPNALAAGLRIVPLWAWLLGGAGFLCAQYYFDVVLPGHSDPTSARVRAVMGIMAGTALACYLFLIGYVSRDAPRRQMSSLLWTLIALLIPNGLGIVLYFILRQPLPGLSAQGRKPFGTPSSRCPRCQRTVDADDSYCRSCGTSLQPQESATG